MKIQDLETAVVADPTMENRSDDPRVKALRERLANLDAVVAGYHATATGYSNAIAQLEAELAELDDSDTNLGIAHERYVKHCRIAEAKFDRAGNTYSASETAKEIAAVRAELDELTGGAR